MTGQRSIKMPKMRIIRWVTQNKKINAHKTTTSPDLQLRVPRQFQKSYDFLISTFIFKSCDSVSTLLKSASISKVHVHTRLLLYVSDSDEVDLFLRRFRILDLLSSSSTSWTLAGLESRVELTLFTAFLTSWPVFGSLIVSVQSLRGYVMFNKSFTSFWVNCGVYKYRS